MPFRLLLSAALIAVPATAQTSAPAAPSPSEAAKAFTLDGMAPNVDPEPDIASDTAVTAPERPADAAVATAPAEPSAPDTAAPASVAGFTLDTPIARLIADPGAKAVLDRDLPGLSGDTNLDKFRLLSLRTFQPLTGGQLSDALLTKVGVDLAALPDAPAKPARTKRAAQGR